MKIIVWLVLCLIWGTTWFFIKIGLEDLPPLSFAASRFILALLILAAIILWRKIPLPKTKRDWQLLGLTGFLQFSFNYATVFWGEQYVSSGLAAVLQAMIPVFGIVWAWVHLPAEKITGRKVWAILLGVCGVAIIFAEQLHVNNWLSFVGCAAIVFGACAAAESSILTKKFGGNLHPTSLVFGQMICGILPLFFVGLWKEGNPLQFNWTFTAVLSVLYLATVGTIVAFWLYYWLLSRIESTKAMTISLVTPLVAVIIGGVFLGEKLLPQTILGGALVLTSVGLVVFRKIEPQTKEVGLKNIEEHSVSLKNAKPRDDCLA